VSPRLPWLTGDHEVLSVITARSAAGSRAGRRDDPHRVALVIEGGGMRGAYLGGMIRALSLLGLRDGFDEVIAVSAGAFTATGFVTDRVERSVAVYAEDLAGGEFISWPRYLRRRGPLMSLDFLIDEIMTRRRPFPFEELTERHPRIRPVATDLDALTAVAFTGLESAEDWRLALRASGTVPLVGGDPVEIAGRRYLDGFVADPLPLAKAINAGATHVLALVARAPGERVRTTPGRGHAFARRHYDRLAPGFAALVAERATSYADSLAIITDRNHRHRGDAKVLAVRPTHPTGVAALTTDPAKLWRAGDAGEDAVRLAVSFVRRLDRAGAAGVGAGRAGQA